MKTALRKKIVILSLLLFYFLPLFAQVLSQRGLIKAVHEADIYYYYDQNYEKASALYESLLKIYPENSNFSAKLGICYLNLDGKKADALRLLSKASLNIVNNDKEYIEYGEKAPLDTYLYLAVAYHQNDSLQKAITLYSAAKKRLSVSEIFRSEYIDNQIRDCKYAIEMKKKPLTILTTLFAPWLNDYPGACNPVLAKNDSVFVFTVINNGQSRILCSYKSGSWKKPVDITKQFGGYDRYFSNSITGDGRLLIIYMDDGGNGNLYYSQRKDSTWTKIKSLGNEINTIYWESHGFITPDGKTLYFASNRPGGAGELDIWVSEKADDGSWKRPLNCGTTINTPYNENTPFFDSSSNTLTFSSIGHLGMGGYDVFRSIKKNGIWTEPIGLPYSFNNTLDNTFFILSNNSTGYITSLFNEKDKSRNIYSISAEDNADKIISANGTVSLQDGMPFDPVQMQIQLFDQKTGSLLKNISVVDSGSFKYEMKPGKFKIIISRISKKKTDTINLNVNVKKEIKEENQTVSRSLIDTASFKFEVKPGDYQLFINHIGYKTDTINLSIPSRYSGNYISINSSLVPNKVSSGDFLTIKNLLFDFDSYKLTNEAISTLEILESILISYPELKIEVAGYTDSKGSTEYNRKLAYNRVQEVINYLTASGILPSRFIKKAFGKSEFEALNTNPDGSDNPEGRKYNRRVTFGIVDPKTGVIIHQDDFTPEYLRQPFSMKYSIVLVKTRQNLAPDYFRDLKINEMHFIKTIKTDSVSFYILGLFYNKTDALKYLVYAKENGFKDACLINQYEIKVSQESPNNSDAVSEQIADEKVYTIQLKASKTPLNLGLFKGIEGVNEIYSDDGYYRYVYGKYSSFSKAKAEVVRLQESGFRNAFIRELNLLTHK
jgi:outer membrane protein OmpA-like peptidoglycan-associated protein/tetratricopeptide (TPR) repeat protein